LLFFLLTSFSLFLLIHNSEFQRSKYLSAFQEIAGRVYLVSSSVESYLNLKNTNVGLMQRIVVLEEEVQRYKKEIENLHDRIHPDSINIGSNQPIYNYSHARVVFKQVSETNNFIVLNKGSNDSIEEDMAVVSAKGEIVGAVVEVTPNFSRVILVLNSGYHPSCIIKNTRFAGSLFWDGKDPRYVHLRGLPSHSTYTIGDTIVTSGYSAVFPEGVFVGVVEDAVKRKNEEFNSLKVHLFTDFSTMDEVIIIRNALRKEQLKMEKGASEE